MRRPKIPALFLLIVSASASLGAQTAKAQEDQAADTGLARDQSGRPTPALISERLRMLLGEARAEALAGRALRHARQALVRSEELRNGGRLDAAERAQQIAWAALTLASRQIARAREREALARGRRRLVAAEASAARSRQALEHAMRQRAQAMETEDRPAEPRVVADDDPEEEDAE
jgi:hypothetical protein